MTKTGQKIDRYTTGPMFAASLAFLLLLAGTLHLNNDPQFSGAVDFCTTGMLWLWPLFVVEFVAHLLTGSSVWKQRLLFCFIPPLRIGGRNHENGRSVWLPWTGWVEVDEELQERLEKTFSIPMMGIALMVLPLMALEYFAAARLDSSPALKFSTQIATGLIWLSFTFEFVVMISVVDRKFQYCKEHWIDVAVICLPLIAFLRAARLGRLLRLNGLTRSARLTKMLRVYRLRGILMRMYRAALVLEVVERLLRPAPEKRLAKLQEAITEKEEELDDLRCKVQELEEQIASEQSEQSPAQEVA